MFELVIFAKITTSANQMTSICRLVDLRLENYVSKSPHTAAVKTFTANNLQCIPPRIQENITKYRLCGKLQQQVSFVSVCLPSM